MLQGMKRTHREDDGRLPTPIDEVCIHRPDGYEHDIDDIDATLTLRTSASWGLEP